MAHEPEKVLALFPNHPGYAYAFFTKPSKLRAWAVKMLREPHRRRNARTASDVEALLDKFSPDTITVEDCTAPRSRRCERIRRLHRSIAHLARTRTVDLVQYSREAVRKTFEGVGAGTRYEIAQAVSRDLPELRAYLPKRRRSWETERAIMGLFAAAALALTHYRTAAKDGGAVADG